MRRDVPLERTTSLRSGLSAASRRMRAAPWFETRRFAAFLTMRPGEVSRIVGWAERSEAHVEISKRAGNCTWAWR